MYKVFFNEKSITITVEENITLIKTTPVFVDSYSSSEINKWFNDFVKSKETEVFLIHQNPEAFFELFKSGFINVPAAGGVVFRKNEMLVIFRNEKWDLPKGKMDTGETAEEAAVREVTEECGISNLHIQKQLPSTFHVYISPYKKTKGEWIFKETFWFEMIYSGKGSGKPQQEEGITKIVWFSKNGLYKVLSDTYENLKPIFQIYRD
jgi:8-oxo-dGTP pyrophosphatase MutT (NUDIX family)